MLLFLPRELLKGKPKTQNNNEGDSKIRQGREGSELPETQENCGIGPKKGGI
jgi:hypothetical protein